METGETPKLKEPKAKEDIAIVKGAEFIRVYPASIDGEAIAGFLTKDPNYKKVGADGIDRLVVEWNDEKEDPRSPGNKITYRAQQRYTRAEHGEEMFAMAVKLKAEKRAVILYY